MVALPLLRGADGVDTLGYSAHAPGAYAEQMLVSESLMMPVPNGLATVARFVLLRTWISARPSHPTTYDQLEGSLS